MSVPIGTTPTFTLTFSEQSGVDLTQAANVYVTFCSGTKTVTKTGDDLTIEQRSVGVMLSQEETLSFIPNVAIQANWTTPDGKRIASEVVNYKFDPQLLMKVIE